MKIVLNGKAKEVNQNITIANLLINNKLDSNKVVVEYNMEIIKKDKYDKITLKEGDRLEILKFVGGG